MSSKKTIDIKIISDVVCPWCFVGKRRLEKAMKQVADKYEFKIRWLPFLLDPDTPLDAVDYMKILRKRYGGRSEAMTDMMTRTGVPENIAFKWTGAVWGDTKRAHRLLEFAENTGKQDEVLKAFIFLILKLSELLFKYQFELTKDVTNVDQLAEAAETVGLDKEKAKKYLLDNENNPEMDKKIHSLQREYGVSGVPFFIFNDKFAFSGAQSPEAFLEVFRKVTSD